MPENSLSGSVGAEGANHSNDARAVRVRLRELGFSWLNESDSVNAEFTRTIRLFQGVKSGLSSGSGLDGRIDVGRDTHLWLHAANSPRWQEIRESPGDLGWMKLFQAGDDHNFGTDWLFQTIVAAGVKYHGDHLAAHPHDSLIVVNDVSLTKGQNTPEHAGHETTLI